MGYIKKFEFVRQLIWWYSVRKGERKRSDVYEIIAKNIRAERKKQNLTQAKLAEKTGYSHEFIRRIEAPNTKKYFSIDTVSNIADALVIELKQLFDKHYKE